MLWSRPYTATGAITKNRFVKYAADDTHVSQASAVTDRIVGVYIGPSDAADGDPIEVCILGECNLEVSGAIGRGTRLTTNASGQGVTAESGGSSRTCAVAMISGTSTTIPVFVQLGPEVQTLLSDAGDTGTGNYTFNGNTTSNNFIINSASGAIQANSSTGLYLRGNIADGAGNVGVWIGNGTTLTNATARIAGFTADTPVTHASPVLYIRKDGALEPVSGQLISTGSITASAVVNKTSGYTATVSDQVITCDATSAAFTITLPAVASTTTGKTYTIKKTDSTANAVTIDGNASETIDGLLTQQLIGQYGAITIVNTGSAWTIVDRVTGTPPFLSNVDIEAVIGAVTLSLNNAYVVRVTVPAPITLTKLSVFIGTASGNIDVGIYRSDGTTLTRLVSAGSTAAAGASAMQTLTISSTTLYPGFTYYYAVAPDNTTVTIGRVGLTAAITAMGQRVQAFSSSFPLPSTLTLASGINTSNCPFIFGEP